MEYRMEFNGSTGPARHYQGQWTNRIRRSTQVTESKNIFGVKHDVTHIYLYFVVVK